MIIVLHLMSMRYPNKSCEDMLDDKRTFNMRKANIR